MVVVATVTAVEESMAMATEDPSSGIDIAAAKNKLVKVERAVGKR